MPAHRASASAEEKERWGAVFFPLVPLRGFWLLRGERTFFHGLVQSSLWFFCLYLDSVAGLPAPAGVGGFSDHRSYLYFSSERAQQVLPSQGRSTAEAFAESVAVLPLHFLASCPQSPFSLLQMKFRGRGACSYHTQTALVKSQNSKKVGH